MASSRIKRTNSFSSYVAALNKDVQALQAQSNNITSVADAAISGDQLANETTLGTNTIKSSNYAEGLTGWKIDGTGVAEFSDVFVRGDINAYSGTIGYWNISNPGVERNIGSKRLFGTFIESDNLGDDDKTDNLGVYVGLYRSYREAPIVVTGAYRIGDSAVIIAPGHGYKHGDKVTLAITGTATYHDDRKILVTNKELVNNIATLTTSEVHPYRVGDSVVVEGVDDTFDGTYVIIDNSTSTIPKSLEYTIHYAKVAADVSSTSVSDSAALVHQYVSEVGFNFSTGPGYVTVTESDFTSFRYENFGSNIDFAYSVNFTGTASMHDENIAGLYLNDYSKALFDHGYFSNEGINYVSAQVFNLIHNPGFEYLNENKSLISSTEGWTTDSDIAISTHDMWGQGIFRANSEFAAKVYWGPISYVGQYVYGKVNYSLSESAIKYGRSLYLDLDSYANPVGEDIYPLSFTLSSDASEVVVNAPLHGLKVGDWVFSDYIDDNGNSVPSRANLIEDIGTDSRTGAKKFRRIARVFSVDGDQFTVKVFGRSQGTTLFTDNQVLFKINVPKFNIADLKFKFSNDSIIPITDILDDTTKALWATTPEYQYLTLGISDIDEALYSDGANLKIGGYLPHMTVISLSVLNNGTSIDYIKKSYDIKINSAKLYQKYKEVDPTGLVDKSDFKLMIPGWIQNTTGDIAVQEYYIDSLYISSQDKYFNGGSSLSSQSWYTPEGVATVAPDLASIQAPKTWIDVDLEAQTSRFNYVDSLSLSTPGFSGSLISTPGIYNLHTIDDQDSYLVYPDDNSAKLSLSSGRFQTNIIDGETNLPAYLASKPSELGLVSYETNLSTSVSTYDTVSQWTSAAQYSSAVTGEIASTYISGISLYSQAGAAGIDGVSEIYMSADSITFSNFNSWYMLEGTRSPLQINFEGQANFTGLSTGDYYDITDMVRDTPGSGDTTSTWTITFASALGSSVKADTNFLISASSYDGFNDTTVFTFSEIASNRLSATFVTTNSDFASDPALTDTMLIINGGWITTVEDIYPRISSWPLTDYTNATNRLATTKFVQEAIKLGVGTGGGGGGGTTYTFAEPLVEDTESHEVSITSGLVYNTDSAAYAKLWVGATTPSGAANGDVWIQVP